MWDSELEMRHVSDLKISLCVTVLELILKTGKSREEVS